MLLSLTIKHSIICTGATIDKKQIKIQPLISTFNHFVSNCSIYDLDTASYADDFTLLASATSIMEAETRANQLCSSLVSWAYGKQLAIAPQKSSVTLFTSDTYQFQLHLQV